MGQITGAIIGITLVLISVFIPMAFFPGSVGIIYKQFSVAMVAAIGFSALMALSLTPALCATLLKPVEAGHHHAKRGLFGWFNRRMDATRDGYRALVERLLRRTGRVMLIYVAILVAVGWALFRLPGGFLPIDDQGFITVDVQAPPEASYSRTLEATKATEQYPAEPPGRGPGDVPHRLQLPRPGRQHRAGLRHAEALVGARTGRFRRAHRRRREREARQVGPRRQDLGAAAAADRQSRQLVGLQLPPPGSRPEGLCRTDPREGSAARRRRAQPDAAGCLRRRPRARAAGRIEHRPRKGVGLRRDLRGDQQHDLDQPRLGLRQRFPESRPDAARRRAGRPVLAHAGRQTS